MYPPPKSTSPFQQAVILPHPSQDTILQTVGTGPAVMGSCLSQPIAPRAKKTGSKKRIPKRHIPKLSTIPEGRGSVNSMASMPKQAVVEEEEFPLRSQESARLSKFDNASICNLAGNLDNKMIRPDDHVQEGEYDPFADFDDDSGEDQLENCPELEQVVQELVADSQRFAIHVEDRLTKLQTELDTLRHLHEVSVEKAKADSAVKEADIMRLIRLVNRTCERCDTMETELRRMRREMRGDSFSSTIRVVRDPWQEE